MLTRAGVVIAVLSLLLPGAAFAQGFSQGNYVVDFTLNGNSENDFDSTILALQGELGYFLTPNIEGAVRQSVKFSDIKGVGSSTNAFTAGAVDYNYDMGRLWPFVGANLGYAYGNGVSDSWEVAIEGGAKYFVGTNTFLLGRMEYQWLLDSDNDKGFSDGQWVYILGIGFKW